MQSTTKEQCKTHDHVKTNKSLISKIFGNKLNPTPDYPVADDSASTMSEATLVQGQEQPKTLAMSKDEQTSISDLMAKAHTMPSEQFKAYLANYKKDAEAAQRRQSSGKSWEYSSEFLRDEPV